MTADFGIGSGLGEQLGSFCVWGRESNGSDQLKNIFKHWIDKRFLVARKWLNREEFQKSKLLKIDEGWETLWNFFEIEWVIIFSTDFGTFNLMSNTKIKYIIIPTIVLKILTFWLFALGIRKCKIWTWNKTCKAEDWFESDKPSGVELRLIN